MKQYARLALVAALVLCAAAPAAADQKSELQTNVTGALKAAKSVVETAVIAAQGISATTVYVAPDRYKTDVAIGPNALTVIVVGNDSYTSRNGAPFVKTALSPAMQAQVKSLTGVSVAALKPDVTVNGTSLGAFDTVYATAAQTETLTCTYDKKTYRLVRCANDDFVQTFDNYDDPKNVIELPKDVK